jgi:hypothetical protein
VQGLLDEGLRRLTVAVAMCHAARPAWHFERRVRVEELPQALHGQELTGEVRAGLAGWDSILRGEGQLASTERFTLRDQRTDLPLCPRGRACCRRDC